MSSRCCARVASQKTPNTGQNRIGFCVCPCVRAGMVSNGHTHNITHYEKRHDFQLYLHPAHVRSFGLLCTIYKYRLRSCERAHLYRLRIPYTHSIHNQYYYLRVRVASSLRRCVASQKTPNTGQNRIVRVSVRANAGSLAD